MGGRGIIGSQSIIVTPSFSELLGKISDGWIIRELNLATFLGHELEVNIRMPGQLSLPDFRNNRLYLRKDTYQ